MSATSTPTGADDAVTERRLVVASVPAGHVYVRHLSPVAGGGPERLPDPDPDDERQAASQRWWPPVMLEPGWVETHDFDLMHLHFGFDARTPAELTRLVDALHRTGRPLVFTVHDLRNPHHEDRSLHDAQLDVLVPAADALITLTTGAADEIRRRWGREAVVLPHPHVVPLEDLPRFRLQRRHRLSADDRFRVGVHLKSLRASMDPGRILPTLVATVEQLPRAVLQVNVHRDVMAGTSPRRDPGLVEELRRLQQRGQIELHVHDYLSDEQLWAYLAGLDVSVLPYRFGTHSGWLEACRDLGTTVIAPSCGYYADQGPVLGYVHDEDRFDPSSLSVAVRRAHQERPDLGASVDERERQRRQVAVGHDLVYRAMVRP